MSNIRIISVAIILALALGAVFFDKSANAQGTTVSCTNVAASGTDVGAGTGYSYNAACLGNTDIAGTTIVSASTAVAAANATAGLVLNRVAAFRAGGATVARGGVINWFGLGSGASAGEKSNDRIGLWVNGAYTRTVGTATDADFDTNAMSTMIGIDFRVSKDLLVGFSAGYEDSDGDTGYNRGSLDSEGRTIAPYLSLQLGKNASVDAVVGYTWLEYDSERTDPLSLSKIIGSTDADRRFGSINLVGNWETKDVVFGAKLGTMYIDEDQDAYTETGGANNVAVGSNSVTVGTANLGVRLDGKGQVSPFIEASVSHDYNDAGGTAYAEDTSFGGAIGLNIDLGDGLSANIEGRGNFRDELKTGTGSATLRYEQKF